MIIKWKTGGERSVPYNPRLGALLVQQGHRLDFDPESLPKQRKHERDQIQKQYDWIQEQIACGKKY